MTSMLTSRRKMARKTPACDRHRRGFLPILSRNEQLWSGIFFRSDEPIDGGARPKDSAGRAGVDP